MRRDRGASAVEYGLMLAAIAAVIVAAVFVLGGVVGDLFSSTQSCFEAGVDSTC
jgi:pilus assembly protein Flp/PilA